MSQSFFISIIIIENNDDTQILIPRKAKAKSLVKRDARWTLVFHDWNDGRFETSMLGAKVTFLTMNSEQCCIILRENGKP